MSNQTYNCPKCGNTLLRANKMLHDLKCTEQRPATYENILSQNVYSSFDGYNYDLNSNMNNLANSGLRRSASAGNFKRMSYVNNDGTTTEIKKDTNMSGKEELLEITYDPQGNIISRKKADGGRSSVRFNFHEIQEFHEYDPFDNYNIYEGGSVYVQTIPTENIQIVTTTTNIPVSNLQVETEHNFGNTGYSLMDNNINGINIDNLTSTNYASTSNTSTNNDYNKYFDGTYSNTINSNNMNNNNFSTNTGANTFSNYNFDYNYNYDNWQASNAFSQNQYVDNFNSTPQYATVTKLNNV